MHRRFFTRFLIVGLAVSLAAIGWGQTPAETTDPGTITATAVRGNVFATVKATGVRSQIANNAELLQGTIVETEVGASVILVFENGATVNLAEDSQLDIEQFTMDPLTAIVNVATLTTEPTRSNTRLRLNRGEIVGKVATLRTNEGSSFNVSTPVGAAGIRGTTFRIVFRPTGNGQAFTFSMTTLEGDVEVTLASGTVAAPVSVTDNLEIVLAEVTVDIDPVTNVVTVTTAQGAAPIPIVVAASVATTQAIQAAAQQIAAAVVDVVITTTGSVQGGGNTGQQNQQNQQNQENQGNQQQQQQQSPPATQNAPRTTTGDGRA
jgi:hypothetical protein